MKFLPLIWKNATRNPRRTALTLLSVAVSLMLLTLLLAVEDSMRQATSEAGRSLRVRWVTAGLTMAGVALVVGTFVGAMALAAGLSRTIGSSADPDNAVVLFKGGISEAMSRVTMEQYQLLRLLPQIARTDRGEPVASLESLVQINLERKSGGETLVVLCGMQPVGFQLRRTARQTTASPVRRTRGGAGAVWRFRLADTSPPRAVD